MICCNEPSQSGSGVWDPGSGRSGSGTRRAFTLVELLVVIAIIALLISILLPALSSAKKTGRAALCVTRLRSQGQAMEMYSNDNLSAIVRGEDQFDDFYGSEGMHFAASLLPGLGYQSPQSISQIYRSWNELEYLRIIGSTLALQCPDFPNPDQPLDFVVNAFRSPYPHTTDDGGGQHGSGPMAEAPISDVTNIVYDRLNRLRGSPARWIYITEAHKDLPTTTVGLSDLFYTHQLPLGSFPRIADDLRHPGGINALFFDGHVDRMSHKLMDAGWPNNRAMRLRFFTDAK